MPLKAHSVKKYQVLIETDEHSWMADEPEGIGDDAGPNPFELLLSAVASCVIITLHMYAERKGWALECVEAELDIHAALAKDVPGSTSAPNEKVHIIQKRLTFHGDLTAEQISRLGEIAGHCPVQRALAGEILFEQIIEP